MNRRLSVAVTTGVLLGLALAPGSVPGVRAAECLTVKGGTAHEVGRFKADGKEKSYCLYVHAGQTMKVTIKPLAPGMSTEGHITFPSGQQDGGPGGVIFAGKLPEEGRYEIRVGRRFEKKPGAFELSVQLK